MTCKVLKLLQVINMSSYMKNIFGFRHKPFSHKIQCDGVKGGEVQVS